MPSLREVPGDIGWAVFRAASVRLWLADGAQEYEGGFKVKISFSAMTRNGDPEWHCYEWAEEWNSAEWLPARGDRVEFQDQDGNVVTAQVDRREFVLSQEDGTAEVFMSLDIVGVNMMSAMSADEAGRRERLAETWG